MTSLPTRHACGSARLEAAVSGVTRILTASAPLSDVLQEVLDQARVVLPGAASLLVRTDGHDDLVAASDAAVGYLATEGVTCAPGPVLTALTTATTVAVGAVHTDARWPVFGRRAGGASVRSVVATGLRLDERTTAVVAHWSSEPDAFAPDDVDDAAAFAAHTLPVLQNALVTAELRRRIDNLSVALTSRAVIDQAIGILRSRTGSSAEQALDRLRSISQREHVKVHDIADRTVRDAVNRSRARAMHTREPAGVTS